VEKKIILTAVCISALLLSAVAGTQLLNLGRADPYLWYGDVPPDAYTKPPAITIFSENNTVYYSNNLTISFDARILPSPNASNFHIYTIYCNTSWQNDSVVVYQWSSHVLENPYDDDPKLTEISQELNLTNIPEGKQNVTIQAVGDGTYLDGYFYNTFSITGSSSISFTIDTTPPIISILSPENKAYSTSDVPLNFTVNEASSQLKYCLDGQNNVTIAGNVTLSGLSDGAHNLRVYAWNEGDKVGVSKTITFAVVDMFQTVLVLAIIVTVIVIAVGLLFYFKKRKH
jgi:hypothetical protein